MVPSPLSRIGPTPTRMAVGNSGWPNPKPETRRPDAGRRTPDTEPGCPRIARGARPSWSRSYCSTAQCPGRHSGRSWVGSVVDIGYRPATWCWCGIESPDNGSRRDVNGVRGGPVGGAGIVRIVVERRIKTDTGPWPRRYHAMENGDAGSLLGSRLATSQGECRDLAASLIGAGQAGRLHHNRIHQVVLSQPLGELPKSTACRRGKLRNCGRRSVLSRHSALAAGAFRLSPTYTR